MTGSSLVKSIGRGLLAGAAGTAVMTAVTALEGKLTDKEDSSAPARAAEKILGVDPDTEKDEKRLNNAMHWGYGTAWGVARGLLGAAEVKEPGATGLFFGAVWVGALGSLPALGVAPPSLQWGAKELAIDAVRHGVYAGTVSATYNLLDR